MCLFLEADFSERQIGVRYEVAELPITLPFQKPVMDKPNPKQGIGKLIVSVFILDNELNIYFMCHSLRKR